MGRISNTGSTFTGHQMVGSEGPPKFKTTCGAPKFVQLYGPKGAVTTQAPCGKCKHCMWVRREVRATSVAMEIETSEWALWLTLTIGPKGEPFGHHKVIDKKLMQDFHKRCRAANAGNYGGFRDRDVKSWRYVQCGEYGERRGRAHYHCVIFGKGDRPTWGDRDAERINIPEWGWGHVNVKVKVDRGVAYYLSKYMRKSGDTWHSASSDGAIGGEYARKLGRRSAECKMPLPSMNWRHSTTDMAGRRRRALIMGAKCREVIEGWLEGGGADPAAMAKMWPETMWSSVVKHWADLRRRQAGLSRRDVLRVERIKRETKAAFWVALGYPAPPRNGGPVKPAGWVPPAPVRSADDDGETTQRREAASAATAACSAAARAAKATGADVYEAVRAVRDRLGRLADVGAGIAAGAAGPRATGPA